MDRLARCAKTIGGCHLVGLCLVICLLPAAAMAQTVTVADSSFSPSSISITAGQTVTWTWGGGTTLAHNVDSGSGCSSNGLFNSGATKTSGTYGHQFTTVGTYFYFCDPHCSFMTGSVTVGPGAASFLVISGAPSTVTAGNSFNVTVTAYDFWGNVATGFGGTVFFTSTDGQAVLPSSTLSGGSGSFNITLKTAGSQNITANASGVSPNTVFGINVGHAAANHFLVSAPASVNAGTAFSFTVTAQDPYGNTDPTFGGTVSFTSTDPQAVLPAANTLISGTRTFSGAILKTSGNRTITATSGITGTSNAINVIPGAATHYTIAAPPTVAAGASFSVTVTALDTFNNIATGYAGSVHFTSSDGTAVLPANSGLVNGTSIFAVTLNTQGSQSITATDTVSSGITATANVVVSPPCPAAAKTFSNTNPVAFSVTGSGGTATTSPYPSQITVSGMTGQVVGKITLTLKGLTDKCPADAALLLQGPTGKFMIPFALIGPCSTVSGINLTLDDSAASQLPSFPTALSSGTYKPASYIVGFGAQPIFQPPAPANPYSGSQLAAADGSATFASVFNGTDPNGVWSLYVLDQPQIGPPPDNGQFAGGWSLTITPAYLFTNPGFINIPDVSPASPYPSDIPVAGVPGNIANMSVVLNGLSHTFDSDLGVLLVGAQGQQMVLMSGAAIGETGPPPAPPPAILTFDDSGVPMPASVTAAAPLSTGIYKPSDYIARAFAAPAPTGPYSLPQTAGSATLASVFNGSDPNGTCHLYVVDDVGGDFGSIANGWSLLITATCPVGTSASVISSANPSVFGQPVTFTATITSAGGTPFGTVTFMDGATTLGTAALAGSPATANFSTSGLAVGSHNITAIYGGNTTFATSTSATLPQIVNQASTVTSTPSPSSIPTPNPSVYGNAVTFTSTVTAVSPGAGTPTGTVTFMDGVTAIGSGVVAGGIASYTTTPATQLAAGGHSITALYSGDTNFTGGASSALSQTVNPAGTTTGVSTSGTPSVYGVNVTFKASVVSNTSGTPTGTVTFKDGTTPIGVAGLVSGIASLPTTLGVSGSPHSITALYSGDTNFTVSSSGPVLQTVTPASTGTALITSGSPTVFGQPVTFTATVTDTAAGSTGTPTGTVTFTDGATVLGSRPLSGGVATLITGSLGVGPHSIKAAYNAEDPNFAASTSVAVPQNVTPAATNVVVSSSLPGGSTYGQAVTFNATVAATAPGSGNPTGSVTFKDGATALGPPQPISSNVASFTTTNTQLAGGSHSITAVYGGDANFTGSNNNSSPFTQVVNPAGSSTHLSPPSASVFGQPVTFTATVTDGVAGGATPTGTVTFKDGAAVLGTGTLSGSPATAIFTTTSSLAVGTHHIAGAYGGDTNYSGNTSPQISQMVTQASASVALVQSASVSIFRQPFTLTATVADSSLGSTGTPTGTVTFMDGTLTLGVGTLSSGQFTITVTTGLPVGEHTFTVIYSGDANFSGNTSLPIPHLRSPAPRHIPSS